MTSKTVCVFTLPAPASPSVGPNSSFYFYENTLSQNLVRMCRNVELHTVRL